MEFQGERNSSFSTICCRYMPVLGAGSAVAFSSYVMNPKLFQSAFGTKDVVAANSLWFNAHIGIGLYIYSRKHIQQTSFSRRLLYSTFGAVVFNFGSVLFWAASKSVLPKNNAMRMALGILSGIAFIVIGKDYLCFVDRNTIDRVVE